MQDEQDVMDSQATKSSLEDESKGEDPTSVLNRRGDCCGFEGLYNTELCTVKLVQSNKINIKIEFKNILKLKLEIEF